VRIGVSLPTCKEGLNLPLPFCEPDELLDLFVHAERCNYDSAWGNDHITAPAYVREDYDDPPRFYEPLIVFAAASSITERIRLGTAVLVLPMRDPVYLAKELATLDRVSRGRVIAGVGTGAYREEFVRSRPRLAKGHRAEMLDEGIELLTRLLSGERTTHDGKYYAVDGLELHPTPVQDPLPVYIGGNSANVIERVARVGHGWLPGALPVAKLREGSARIRERAAELGRDGEAIDIAPQYLVAIGRTHEEALARFRASRLYVHLQSLSGSTLSGHALPDVEAANLIGTPADLVEQLGALREAGATSLAATSFVSDTPEQMADDMEWFSREVMGEL
jgi:probable F420-dependent oxidoreductase